MKLKTAAIGGARRCRSCGYGGCVYSCCSHYPLLGEARSACRCRSCAHITINLWWWRGCVHTYCTRGEPLFE